MEVPGVHRGRLVTAEGRIVRASASSVGGASSDLPGDSRCGQLGSSFLDDGGQIGEPAVIEADVHIADLQMQAPLFAPVDAAVVRLCQHFIPVVAQVVVHRASDSISRLEGRQDARAR